MNRRIEIIETKIQPMMNVDIHWYGGVILGNNRLVLLEQLEQAGICIPYSCRIGVCNCCRIKLVRGKVSALKKSAIGNDGAILCCSCVPQTSIKLEL